MPHKELPINADKLLLAIGSLLRDARLSRKKTQEQLAREAQIGRSYVSMIERGLADPTIDILFRMAAALGVCPSSMFRQAEDQTKRRRAARRPTSGSSRTPKTGTRPDKG